MIFIVSYDTIVALKYGVSAVFHAMCERGDRPTTRPPLHKNMRRRSRYASPLGTVTTTTVLLVAPCVSSAVFSIALPVSSCCYYKYSMIFGDHRAPEDWATKACVLFWKHYHDHCGLFVSFFSFPLRAQTVRFACNAELLSVVSYSTTVVVQLLCYCKVVTTNTRVQQSSRS